MACYDVTYSDSEHDSLLYTLSNSEDDVDYTIDNDNEHESGEESDASTGPITKGSDTSCVSDDDYDEGDINDSIPNISEVEMWSETSLNSILSDFNGSLRLSDNIALNFPQNPSPIDMFRLFLIPELTGYIIDQSNLYRTQNNLMQQSPMTIYKTKTHFQYLLVIILLIRYIVNKTFNI